MLNHRVVIQLSFYVVFVIFPYLVYYFIIIIIVNTKLKCTAGGHCYESTSSVGDFVAS